MITSLPFVTFLIGSLLLPAALASDQPRPVGRTPVTSKAAARDEKRLLADMPAGAYWVGRFRTLDVDHDGRLTLNEFLAPPRSMLSARPHGPGSVRSSDSSPDGENSFADNVLVFEDLDLNRDGYLTPAELNAYRPESEKLPR